MLPKHMLLFPSGGHSLWHILMIHLPPFLSPGWGCVVAHPWHTWGTDYLHMRHTVVHGYMYRIIQHLSAIPASFHLKFALIHTQPSFPRMRWKGKRKKKIIFTHLLLSQTIQLVSSKAYIFSPSLIDGLCTLIDPLVYFCIGLHYTGIIITMNTILS